MAVTTIIQTIVTAITGLLGGIGESMSGFFDSVFMNGTGEGLSTMGIVILTFVGISFAFGLVNILIRKIKG